MAGEGISMGRDEEDEQLLCGECEINDVDEHGVVLPKLLPAPYIPTRQERLEHEVTHVPYRSWCDHCVRGKGRSTQHRYEAEKQDGVPVIGMDYCFLSKKDGDDMFSKSEVTVLTMKDRSSKCVFGIPVPQKGIDPHDWSVRQVKRCIDFLGYNAVVLRCDQESAVDKVIESVKIHRSATTQTAVEKSPKGDSQSNGLAEQANQVIEGQVRTMIDALENKLGMKVDADWDVVPWLIMHSGLLINRFQVGSDGKTPHERLRGRKSKKELVEFGEQVHYLPLDAGDDGKIDAKWSEGTWLGIKMESDEVIIGTDHGVFRTRSIKRKPADRRWDSDAIRKISGTPWKPYAHTDEDRILTRTTLPRPPGVQSEPSNGERKIEEDPAPKRIRIERRDLERIGYSPGCAGCYSARMGKSHRPHSDQCRRRVLEDMMSIPDLRRKLEASIERENRWLERQAEGYEEVPVHEPEEVRVPEREQSASATPQIENHENMDGAVDDNATMGDDTTEFYREVNEELAERVEEEAMQDINMAQNSEDVINILHKAMSKIMKVHTPKPIDSDKELLQLMRTARLLGEPHVSEIYSPPRVTAIADQFGMRPGFALGLNVNDPFDNKPWNFDDPEKRKRAKKPLHQQRPMLLVGSPMCRAFSVLNRLNRKNMGDTKWNEMVQHGLKHLRFCCELYQIQLEEDRYFLHEHPAYASSWATDEIGEVMKDSRCRIVQGDMCQFGMVSEDEDGIGHIRKPTKFMTNSECLAAQLEKKCVQDHRHIPLWGKRAKAAEIYPRGLCEAILRGLRNQLIQDGNMNMDGTLAPVLHEEDRMSDDRWDEFYDDISGLPLSSNGVREARKEEMRIFNTFPVYTKVPIDEAWTVTGKGPIGTRWLDINKGDEDSPELRSRLVGQEFNRGRDDLMFAATPPLELKKALFSLAVTGTKDSRKPKKNSCLSTCGAHIFMPRHVDQCM